MKNTTPHAEPPILRWADLERAPHPKVGATYRYDGKTLKIIKYFRENNQGPWLVTFDVWKDGGEFVGLSTMPLLKFKIRAENSLRNGATYQAPHTQTPPA